MRRSPSVEITRLAADSAVLGPAVEVERAAAHAADPEATPHTYLETKVALRNLDPTFSAHAWAACTEGKPVAIAFCYCQQSDNTEKGEVRVSVRPDLWRQGIGSKLLAVIVSFLRSEGRTLLIAQVNTALDADDTHPARGFANKHGFTLGNVEVHRVLRLPVPASRLEALLATSAGHHGGYSFAEYIGGLPGASMPAYCDLLNAMNTDSPSGELTYEAGRLTPELFERRLDALAQQGRTLHTSVAFDADDVPVANSELVVPEHDPLNLFQWATLVRRDHRGHRLGLVTKARNLRSVQRRHPERTTVHTWNAESNHFMIAVNDQMGFVPVGYSTLYQRQL